MTSRLVVMITLAIAAGCGRLAVHDGDGMGSQVAKLATRIPLAMATVGLSEVEIGCDSGRLSSEQCGHTAQTVVDGIGRSASRSFVPGIAPR